MFAPTTPAAQQPVFFNGFGSTPGRGTKIVTFSWDFGDGGTGTGMSLSHTYADQALYVVTLTVTDDVGDSAKVSQIVGAIAPPVTTTIPPAPPASGAAQFVGNQTNPLIPSDLTLFFRLLTSVSPSFRRPRTPQGSRPWMATSRTPWREPSERRTERPAPSLAGWKVSWSPNQRAISPGG